jgi:predicted enzyme related to lactoylglutathione lyase
LISVSAAARIGTVIVDCANPTSLAEFYRQLTGWKTTYEDDDFVYLGDGGPVQLGFQRIADYEAPGWPDARKHFHLDFVVDDVETATKELLALGATMPDFQPGEGAYVVIADPEGRPFCLTTAD